MSGRTGTFEEDSATGRVVIPFGLIDALAGNEFGGLGASLIRDYVGDNANSRVIDLGDDYDIVLVVTKEARAQNQDHLAMAHAVRDSYGIFYVQGTAVTTSHFANASGNGFFQGKLSGADANKIMLGSLGNDDRGMNFNSWGYRILGFKLFRARS